MVEVKNEEKNLVIQIEGEMPGWYDGSMAAKLQVGSRIAQALQLPRGTSISIQVGQGRIKMTV